jgi:phosphatidylserine decarboxylase
MYIYKKAYPFLILAAFILIVFNTIFILVKSFGTVSILVIAASVVLYVSLMFFFRVPVRTHTENSNLILSPADGTIVAVEELHEDEFLHTNCIKISIFMSLFNVHQNIVPVNGKLTYFKHHKGKYFFAWLPKSSLKNEHTSIVIDTVSNHQIRISQIAGFIARRIVCNYRENDIVRQGDELGFIFFGSRVDVYLPLSAVIKIKPGDKVRSKSDIIAELKSGKNP